MLLISLVVLLLPLAEAVPSIVTGVTLSVVSDQAAIRVDWHQPIVDGSFIRYEVEYGEFGVRWIANVTVQEADSLTTVIANLDRGTRYVVRVRAVSSAGDGLYSAGSPRPNLILPSLPPQVTGVSFSIVSGQATIRVTWNKPSVQGDFIRYDVQYRTSSQSWDASPTETVGDQNVLTVDLTTLQRGTTYSVRVRAVSNAGNGNYSAEDTATVPARVPSQVTGVSLSLVSGQPTIEVNWGKPDSDRPIIRYEVQYRVSGGSWRARVPVQGADLLTTMITNLDRGSTYAVRVRAVSDAGSGDYSPTPNPPMIAIPNVPSEVTGVMLSAVSGQAAIRVDWNEPSSDLPIIRYEVEYGEYAIRWIEVVTVQGADSLTTTIINLRRGTAYIVRVRAVSGAGAGFYTEPERRPTVILSSRPGAVSDVGVTVVDVQGITITVTWSSPPLSDVPITGYEVDYSESGSAQTPITTTALTLTATINGMSGATYKVRVRALSADDPGDWSPYTTIASPSAPTGVMATSIDTSNVTITWTNDGFNYRIFAQREGSSERPSQDPVSPPYTITGLDSNTGYTITVEAYSPLGRNGTDISVYTVPEAPSSLNLAVVSSTVIRVTWTAPPNADRLSLTYLISYQSEFGSGMEEASTQAVELTGLHPFAEYTVGVEANNTGELYGVNATGKSTTLSAAPSSPPRSVLIVDALKTHNSLTCAWQLPVRANRNGIITSYFIIVTRGSGAEQQPVGNFTKLVDYPSFDAPTHLRYNMTSLVAQTLYSFRIAAVTSGGTGVFSDSLARKTNHDCECL